MENVSTNCGKARRRVVSCLPFGVFWAIESSKQKEQTKKAVTNKYTESLLVAMMSSGGLMKVLGHPGKKTHHRQRDLYWNKSTKPLSLKGEQKSIEIFLNPWGIGDHVRLFSWRCVRFDWLGTRPRNDRPGFKSLQTNTQPRRRCKVLPLF